MKINNKKMIEEMNREMIDCEVPNKYYRLKYT